MVSGNEAYFSHGGISAATCSKMSSHQQCRGCPNHRLPYQNSFEQSARQPVASSTKRRVLYVAYSMATVSDESCGGAEQMLFVLEGEMHRRGHRTTVAACAGSRIAGELVETGSPAIQFEQLPTRDAEHHEAVLALIRERQKPAGDLDLVHDESGRFSARAEEANLPVLVTLNLPRSYYPQELFEDLPENVFFNCVSRTQLRGFFDIPNVLGFVPNGVAVERFSFTSTKSDYLVWLGRICEEKAPHLAMDAAQRAGLPLVLMGPRYLYHRDQVYFDSEVAPRLDDNPNFRLIGSPSFGEKAEVLRQARALLMPTLAEETSSLVCLEAMACGTPAIAFRCGALPEIVRHNCTGLIVDSVEEMAEAIASINGIAPDACRTHVEENHSAARMANEYEQLYERLIELHRTEAIWTTREPVYSPQLGPPVT
jgi:glycosyltransferase involved in cell wall biosynthesis